MKAADYLVGARSLQISREIPRSDKSGEPSQELVTLACRGILENHA
jgi:hypothetical protein